MSGAVRDLAVVAAVAASLSGCGSGSGSASPAPAAHGAPTTPASPGTRQPIRMAPPFRACGRMDVTSLSRLISGGLATALVRITVTDQPGEVIDDERTVPVASSRVLAGQLTDGALRSIQEADQADTNTLAPGDYFVLLGPTGATGSYFLADGVPGSFTLAGNTATEQCPGLDEGGPGKRASIDRQALITRVADALAELGS